MEPPFSGDRSCGAIRYECSAKQGFWAGSLDDPNIVGPQVDVWTRGAPRWRSSDPGLKRLDVALDAERFQTLLAAATTAGSAPATVG